jgi:hypothetical protein
MHHDEVQRRQQGLGPGQEAQRTGQTPDKTLHPFPQFGKAEPALMADIVEPERRIAAPDPEEIGAEGEVVHP